MLRARSPNAHGKPTCPCLGCRLRPASLRCHAAITLQLKVLRRSNLLRAQTGQWGDAHLRHTVQAEQSPRGVLRCVCLLSCLCHPTLPRGAWPNIPVSLTICTDLVATAWSLSLPVASMPWLEISRQCKMGKQSCGVQSSCAYPFIPIPYLLHAICPDVSTTAIAECYTKRFHTILTHNSLSRYDV